MHAISGCRATEYFPNFRYRADRTCALIAYDGRNALADLEVKSDECNVTAEKSRTAQSATNAPK
jgi:hypothetical protein